MQLLDKWEQKLAMLLKSKKISLKCNRNEKASQGAFFITALWDLDFLIHLLLLVPIPERILLCANTHQ